MLLHFLEEGLFYFHTTPFLAASKVKVSLGEDELTAELSGETYDFKRHHRGTEVKAVTRSNLIVRREGSQTHIYVVLDI